MKTLKTLIALFTITLSFSAFADDFDMSATYNCRVWAYGDTPKLGKNFDLTRGKNGSITGASSETIGNCTIDYEQIFQNMDILTSLYTMVSFFGKDCKVAGTYIAMERSILNGENTGYVSVLLGPEPDGYRCETK